MTTTIEFIDMSSENYFSGIMNELMYGYKFGVLKIVFGKPDISEEYLALNLMADMSDSMHLRIKTGCEMTKQQLVNTVLKNIITAISKHPIKLITTITGFDDSLHDVQREIVVTEETVADIHANIDSVLVPTGSTNIEAPVIKLKELSMDQLASKRLPFNLFLTDGQVNIGSDNPRKIAKHIVENTPYAFLGVGYDCDTKLLATLAHAAKNEFGEFSFIADMEDVAVVIGKHVSEFLFMAASNIRIQITGAEIYSYEFDEWTNTIFISKMKVDVLRTFHIRTTATEPITVNISADIPTQFHAKMQKTTTFESSIPTVQNNYEIARHFVLKLLKLATDDPSYIASLRGGYGHTALATNILKKQLKDSHAELSCIMAEDPESASLYRVLADDLYVASQCLTTPFAQEYCVSRLLSNGRESTYNPVNLNAVQDWKAARLDDQHEFAHLHEDVDASPFMNHSLKMDPAEDTEDFEFAHTLLPQFSREHSSEEEMAFIMSITQGLDTRSLFS